MICSVPYPKIWLELVRDLCPPTLSRFSIPLYRRSPKKTPSNNTLLLLDKANEESGVKKRTLVNTTPYRLSCANPFDNDNLEHTSEAVVRRKCPPLFLPPPLTEIKKEAQSKAALTHCPRHTHTQASIHGCRPRPTPAHVFSGIGYHVATFLSALTCSLGPKSSIAHNARQRDCHEKLTLCISVYLCLKPKLSTLAYGHEAVGFSTEQVRKRCDIPKNITSVPKMSIVLLQEPVAR